MTGAQLLGLLMKARSVAVTAADRLGTVANNHIWRPG